MEKHNFYPKPKEWGNDIERNPNGNEGKKKGGIEEKQKLEETKVEV